MSMELMKLYGKHLDFYNNNELILFSFLYLIKVTFTIFLDID